MKFENVLVDAFLMIYYTSQHNFTAKGLSEEREGHFIKGSETRMTSFMEGTDKRKSACDAYRKAKNKNSYREAHEREIILHKATAKAPKTTGVFKLSDISALQAEYSKLQK